MISLRVALSVTAVAVIGLAAQTSTAATVRYELQSTPVTDCNDNRHGLWTNDLLPGTCANFFDIQPQSFIDIDESAGTGRMVGTAINPFGVEATFDITFGDWLDSIDGTGFTYKQGGGPAYDFRNDDPDMNFFTTVGANSVISIDNVDYLFDVADPFTGTTVFQYGAAGTGANAKNDDLGASVWMNMAGLRGRHWDFNLNFAQIQPPPPPPVSEPATLAIIASVALLGLAAYRRLESARA